MHIDQLKEHFPDESACRIFFENMIWTSGRRCPRCKSDRSYGLIARVGVYECAACKKQFTVTVQTPFHGTKLPLWKWIKAIYFILTSSKGVSSVILGRMVGVSQKTAWKMGHAIRQMMETDLLNTPMLNGIVELDEKFIGGKPRYGDGSDHKRGKETTKSQILIATQRFGPTYCHVIESDKISEIRPLVDLLIDDSAHLMTDKSKSHMSVGKQFSDHSSVNHSAREYARGDAHSNTAESFASLLERAKLGVFHHMSEKHLSRYLNEASFRWAHRVGKKTVTKKGKQKIKWTPMPFLTMATSLLSNAFGHQLKRSSNGGLLEFVRPCNFAHGLSGGA
jgi:transposase-like protein